MLFVALVALVALAACGLPDDREPQVITAEEAPLDLDQSNAASNSSSGDVDVTLYFVRDGRLVSVAREVATQTVYDAVNALLSRPTTDEEAAGLRSEIPAETTLLDADVVDGIANIDLDCTTDQAAGALPTNCGIQGAEGTAQLTLFAQLTCTADAIPGVDGVVFFQEGVPQDAPTDLGLATGSEPVDCRDYTTVRG